MIYYKGFNTKNYENFKGKFDVYNVECIAQDLLNEIFTIKGERINMPDYGTRIPLLTFELNDQYVYEVIKEDLETVFSHDPRVKVLQLDIVPAQDKYALIAVVKLRYLEFNVTKDLYIEVNSK